MAHWTYGWYLPQDGLIILLSWKLRIGLKIISDSVAGRVGIFYPAEQRREKINPQKKRENGVNIQRRTEMRGRERESVNLVSSYLPIDWLHPCPWAYATACVHIQILFFSFKLTKVTFSFYNSKYPEQQKHNTHIKRSWEQDNSIQVNVAD